MKFLRSALFLLLAGSLTTPSFARATQSTPQELWVTMGKQIVILSDLGATLRAKFEVAENPAHLAVSPDGAWVAVASYGAVKYESTGGATLEYLPELGEPSYIRLSRWPKPGSESFITIVKRPGYEIAGRYPVPFRPTFMAFTPDGASLVVVSYGQASKNDKKHIPPQVFLLDLATGKLRGQAELFSEPITPWYSPTLNRLLIPCQGVDKRVGAVPELIIYDTAAGELEKIPFPASPQRWRESGSEEWRYLELSTGVIAIGADGKLIGPPILAGSEKLFLVRVPNSHRYLLAGKTNKQGQLVVVENARPAKALEVPPLLTVLFDSKTSRMFLCASKEALIYDLNTFTEQARIPLPEVMREIRLDPTGKRLYVSEAGDNVTVVDIEAKKTTARFATGRAGVKFLKELGTVAAGVLSQMHYEVTGIPGTYVDPLLPAALKSIAFAPSGKFVYVFNDQTNDITVVETKTHMSPRKSRLVRWVSISSGSHPTAGI